MTRAAQAWTRVTVDGNFDTNNTQKERAMKERGRPRDTVWTRAELTHGSVYMLTRIDATNRESEEVLRLLHTGWTGVFDVVDYGAFIMHMNYIKRTLGLSGTFRTKSVPEHYNRYEVKMVNANNGDYHDGFNESEVLPSLYGTERCPMCYSERIVMERQGDAFGAICRDCRFGPTFYDMNQYAVMEWNRLAKIKREGWKNV